MIETHTAFTAEEREFLVALLEAVLKDTLVEEHRTRTLTYREHVLHNEDLIRGILMKLAGPEDVIESH